MLKARTTTATKTIDAVRLRKVADSNPPVEVSTIRIRTESGLKTIWRKPGVLSAVVEISPYGAAASGVSVSIVTSAATVTVSGGFPPYTYGWRRTDADPTTWNAVSPSSATSTFVADSVAPEKIQGSIWVCDVKDDRGNTATSNAITATAQNFGTGL